MRGCKISYIFLGGGGAGPGPWSGQHGNPSGYTLAWRFRNSLGLNLGLLENESAWIPGVHFCKERYLSEISFRDIFQSVIYRCTPIHHCDILQFGKMDTLN